jgi:hypothetical protein
MSDSDDEQQRAPAGVCGRRARSASSGTRQSRASRRARAQSTFVAAAAATALVVIARTARTDDADAGSSAPTPADSLPGSPRPMGLGMSPEAPPVPPAPGGRAPSFGAPASDGEWSLRLAGRFSAFESIGLGRTPVGCGSADCTPKPLDGYTGTALHVPPLVQGRLPFYPGAGATFSVQYGNPIVTANVLYYARISGADYNGYYNPQLGPDFGQAYLVITPEPTGPVRLSWRVGGFVEVYAGPGQWGWGIFGPMLAVRGFGETTTADIDLSPDLRLTLKHGIMGVPGVPENFVRGTYEGWIETGVSEWLQHAHAGLTYKNQTSLTLHYASVHSTDERKYLLTFLNTPPHDGRWDAYLAEGRWIADPWGQIGVTAAFWNFVNAASVGDGIWWGLDWTQGAREMINKYLGGNSGGSGQLSAVGAEYDVSLARVLWSPQNFDGRSPDVRIAVAGIIDHTLSTADPVFKDATGFLVGTEIEYRFSKFFSFTLQAYGENRKGLACGSPVAFILPGGPATSEGSSPCYEVLAPSGQMGTEFNEVAGRWAVYSVNPGISFHSDWLSTDRIQLLYGRRFYSSVVDNNIAQPLDRNMFTLGGYVTF